MVSRSSLRSTPNFGRSGGAQSTRQWAPPSSLQAVPDIPDFVELGAYAEQQGAEQPASAQEQHLHDQLEAIRHDREKVERELLRERRRMQTMQNDFEVKISRLEDQIGRKARTSSASPDCRQPRVVSHPDSRSRLPDFRSRLRQSLSLGEAARTPHVSPLADFPQDGAGVQRSRTQGEAVRTPQEDTGVQRSITQGDTEELAELRERIESMETHQAAQLKYLEKQFYGQMVAWRRELTNLLEHKLQSPSVRQSDGDRSHLAPAWPQSTSSPRPRSPDPERVEPLTELRGAGNGQAATARSSRSSRRSPQRQRNASTSRGRSESPTSSDPYQCRGLGFRCSAQGSQELELQPTSAVSPPGPGAPTPTVLFARAQRPPSPTKQHQGTRLMASAFSPRSAQASLQMQMPIPVTAPGMAAPVAVSASPQARPAWPQAATQMDNLVSGRGSSVTLGPAASATRLVSATTSYPSLPRAPSPASPPSSPSSKIRDVTPAFSNYAMQSRIATMPSAPLSGGLSQALSSSAILPPSSLGAPASPSTLPSFYPSSLLPPFLSSPH